MTNSSYALNAVYVVEHLHTLPGSEEDAKLIGVYTSESEAAAACDRLRKQPGFSRTPDGFTIEKYELNKDHWPEGFVTMAGDCQIDATDTVG